ncbi:Ger(x)C family spore germination protein [Amphibacillus cookii]|uniref:Ger(x)C family spore germination protein n=1 Tax=Amphibacillus cookii TaxID=767787 RepID=UPI0019572148|nr:Ger(x)C family spore germination C-terminal domain-containing protein [Amphibacillus cookii]MBM7541383.1 Ger(x)C family germination protein [Amphibacillus cookii]
MKTISLSGLLILFILIGCEDMVEVDRQSYVIAVGIDVTDQDGIYAFTYQIANPEAGSTLAGIGAEQIPDETITVFGTDIMTATNTANSFVTKQIILDQTRVLIVSEALARSDQFLRIMQSTARTTEIRRSIQIIVSKENASDFINNNSPVLEQRPHKYYQYMLSRAKETGIIPDADLHRFFQITEGDADLFLGIYATTTYDPKELDGSEDEFVAGQVPKEGGNVTQFMGSAVFKEGIMIDRLTGEETRICNILDKTMNINEMLANYPDPLAPEYQVATDVFQTDNPKVNLNYDSEMNHATIDVTVPFEVKILAIPSLIHYSQNEDFKRTLRDAIEQYITDATDELIKKSQEAYRSDPFYWSIYIRRHFKDIPAYEEGDWHKNIYPNADITVNYQLKRLHFGKMLDDTKLDEVRD